MNKFKALIILVVLILGSILVSSVVSKSSNKVANQEQNKRISFDFKALSNDFTEYNNENFGLKFAYPAEMQVNYLSSEEIKNTAIVNELLPVNMGYFLLDPEPDIRGTEFHDGLLISLSYYLYDISIESNLKKILSQSGAEPYESTGKLVYLQGKQVVEERYCCYGGDTRTYHFFTKNKKYYVKFAISSAGPEKEKFDMISEKILQSLEFN